MINRTSPFRMIALGCCAAYILSFLFLPFISVALVGVGLNGMRLLSVSMVALIPLLAGFVMAVSCLTLPKEISCLINGICAFVPLIVSVIERSTAATMIMRILNLTQYTDLASSAASLMLKPGTGAILCIFLGLGAGVLCFLDAGAAGRSSNSAGSASNANNNW